MDMDNRSIVSKPRTNVMDYSLAILSLY